MTRSVDEVADVLYAALRDVVAVPPVRETLPDDLNLAYEVQELGIKRRESRLNSRIGRKVGLTSPAVQKQLGVDQPDFGVLLNDMLLDEDQTIPIHKLIAPRIEAEIAFGIARDVNTVDRKSVMAAVAWVAPALEIVDSRVQNWDIRIIDTVADNASSAYFVLGSARVGLDAVTPRNVSMTLQRDGESVSSGTGRDCLGDPIDALVWVAQTAATLGRPLLAGEVVMSGALGPMVPIQPGETYTAHLSGLGSVSISSSEARS